MAIGGILFVGLIVASISSMVLDRGSTKVSVRMIEKARQRSVKRLAGNQAISELERREEEFNLMRKVQATTAKFNRMIVLSISLTMVVILSFIGAVCFWQAEKSSQNWSYFESLYFTYVSLLTIGYGDFYPQDNSAKPLFVFWALIALPTLTVLIGSVGGIVNEGVNNMTLWISDRSPEHTKALSAMKQEASKAKGDAFNAAKPPGFLEDGVSDTAGTADSTHAEAVHSVLTATDKTKGGLAGRQQSRQYLLIKEIKNVIEHLDATPPRQYSFAEWVWFMKLLGEDESDGATHRRLSNASADAKPKEGTNGAEPNAINSKNGLRQPWSWLGSHSPLITATDEPKWILERLILALETDLKGQVSSPVKDA